MAAAPLTRGSGATAWAPEPVTADPYNAQTPWAALAEPVTPVEAFFVRDHFGIPDADPGRWRMRIGGAVAAPLDLGYAELCAMPYRELDVVLECAGNGRSLMRPRPTGLPWGQGAVGCAHFAGVPFRSVADRARIDAAAVEVVFCGADSGTVHGRRTAFERSLPLAAALHPDTLLATHMNGEPLAPEHGAPVRLVVPGRYAVADVKWLVGARAVTEPFTGPFQTEEYLYTASRGTPDGPVTTVRVKSLVTAPAPGSVLRCGAETLVRGWAWSGGGVAVHRVEVRVEGEGAGGAPSWEEARLEPALGPYGWQEWTHPWTAPLRPGRYRLLARATDEAGHTQPPRAPWNAHGYGCNPVASVEVVVE
ncbi:molybdopterin-dependent oxidoreductase [Streptomyces sp. NPDC046876]|uniref:molybdopterin-dependent oxidoreductase n=1 Tax=Streptomyces sp. NPDC046876 TaxID=3155616 RepID=UPI0033F87C61